MQPSDLEQYLHEHIPLSRAMQVSVVEVAADSVTLAAPIEPNINHRGTVFGGSISAVAILAAWSLLHTRLRGEGVACRLVIQRNSIDYLKPVDGDFTARSLPPDAADWQIFTRMLARKGMARITIRCVLKCTDATVAEFEGEFVALAGGGGDRDTDS
jgi:thioesterase domain-containing protein